MPTKKTETTRATKTFYAPPGTRILFAGENAEEASVTFDDAGKLTVDLDDQAPLAQLEAHAGNPASPVSEQPPKKED